MEHITLANHQVLSIREAQVSDAEELIRIIKEIADESEHLSFDSSEFNISLEEERILLGKHAKSENQVYFVAIIEEKIIGFIKLNASHKKRIRHIGEFGMAVLKNYWNLKIGTHLLTTLIKWAKENKIIRKIDLDVNEHNKNGIALYKKLGFEIEGRRKRGGLFNGEFKDLILMGLEVD